jgi:hypothetical protein
MDETDRRAFLIRYAALALSALASASAAAAPANGIRSLSEAANQDFGPYADRDVYGPPPSPDTTLIPGEKKPPRALYGPPPRPSSTGAPTEPKPPVALYGPPPRPHSTPLDTTLPD